MAACGRCKHRAYRVSSIAESRALFGIVCLWSHRNGIVLILVGPEPNSNPSMSATMLDWPYDYTPFHTRRKYDDCVARRTATVSALAAVQHCYARVGSTLQSQTWPAYYNTTTLPFIHTSSRRNNSAAWIRNAGTGAASTCLRSSRPKNSWCLRNSCPVRVIS